MRSVVVSILRFPRNAAYCAAWNSGFLTTFRWSSGSRNERGEMAHSDALTSACLLSFKGSVASFWLCADDFRSSPTRREIQSPSGLAFVPPRDMCTKAISRSSITSSVRASSGADRETKRLAGCKLAASQKLVGNSIGKSLSAAPRG